MPPHHGRTFGLGDDMKLDHPTPEPRRRRQRRDHPDSRHRRRIRRCGRKGVDDHLAAIAAMVSGGIALGGTKYSEEAAERDAERALVEEERRQLAMLPDEELAEHYRARGLSPDLAPQVAKELTAHDALAAHIVAEHGIDLAMPRRSVVIAAASGVASTIGAAVPLLTALHVPDDLRLS